MNVHRIVPLSLFTACSLLGLTSGFSQSTVVQRNYPGLTITGTVGESYPIQYVNTLANNSWSTLTTLVLPSSPYLFLDTTAGGIGQRFYRESNVVITAQNYVGLTITGKPGSTNMIQYVEITGNTNNWITLTNIVLPTSPYLFVDTISPPSARRRFRAEDLARPPVITSPTTILAQVGVPFSYGITASSYLPITGYAAAGLPPGLNVDISSGIISGTPTAVGTNAVTITATNSTGPGTNTLTLSLRLSLSP